MSRRILITFSGSRYHDSTKRIVEDGPRFGADHILVYDDIWLKEKRPEHCAITKWAFDHPKCRGVNWFCFKAFTVLDALNRSEQNSIVCFTDADCWPVADMTPLYDMCERDGVVLFAACGHSQRHWSKRDTQIVMNMDNEHFRNKQAGVARFMLFKKCTDIGKLSDQDSSSMYTEDFLREWLGYSYDQRANTFDRSALAEEYCDLKEARCEQAILTNLAHKYGIPLHRECDQWGNDFKSDFPNDTYPQIFESTGIYSYDPAPLPGQRGSRFRNVND